MLQLFRYCWRYLDFTYQASAAYSLHSPFLFWLYTEVIQSEKNYYVFDDIERLRNRLLKEKSVITIRDYGAGSALTPSSKRSIRNLAKYSAVPEKKGRLLFHLVHAFKPETALEIGTSLGIGTLYQATASHHTQLYTLEGCPEISSIARENISAFRLNNTTIIQGDANQTLPALLPSLSRLDYVFFDANHQYEATIDYFQQCLQKATENTVFVFDDIHWSQGMEQAWQKIKQHPAVTLTIDLFSCGLVFFRNKQPEQHYKLLF